MCLMFAFSSISDETEEPTKTSSKLQARGRAKAARRLRDSPVVFGDYAKGEGSSVQF